MGSALSLARELDCVLGEFLVGLDYQGKRGVNRLPLPSPLLLEKHPQALSVFQCGGVSATFC